MNYLNEFVPSSYHCHECRATGIKLWREYVACQPKLLCAECAIKDQSRPGISSLANSEKVIIDIFGMRDNGHGMRTDQIGWYVPAVPTEDNETYWGYTSVPQAGCKWWRTLPTYK